MPESPSYWGDGDVNSGPQARAASASPTEPSCLPSTLLAAVFVPVRLVLGVGTQGFMNGC